jgi:hypothetical protein
MAGETSVSLFRDILLNNTIPKLQETSLHLIKKEMSKAETFFFANEHRLCPGYEPPMPKRFYNPIRAMEFSAMFTFQLVITKR